MRFVYRVTFAGFDPVLLSVASRSFDDAAGAAREYILFNDYEGDEPGGDELPETATSVEFVGRLEHEA